MNWIRHYFFGPNAYYSLKLQCHRYKVKTSSEPAPLKRGIPQRSILGLPFFSITKAIYHLSFQLARKSYCLQLVQLLFFCPATQLKI